MKRIALATCRTLPEPDPDEALLLEALRRRGIGAELLPWDGPGGGVDGFDACVLRSCWNYHEAPEEFLAWVREVEAGTRLINSAETVRWNIHKRYLEELERAGMPIIPTVWLDRGEKANLRGVVRDRGWSDVVIKPAVSAASFLTRRFAADRLDEAEAFLEQLLGERDAMVQRYIRTVEAEGERAVVWIDGEITHAVRKSPRFADGVERVSDAVSVTEDERELTRRAIAHLRERPLYARVDVVRGEDGLPVISELELIEPSLFLKQCPEALALFVGALETAVSGGAEGEEAG